MALEVLAPEERRALLLSIGTHKGERLLSPVEVAELLRKAISGGASPSECASALQLEGPSQVSRFVALLKLPSDLQHLVDWGRSKGALAFTTAFEISRLNDADDQRVAMEATLEHDLSSSEVRQLVQCRRRSAEGMAACVKAVLRMRPQVEVRNVFVGAILGQSLREALRARPQKQRDAILQEVLATRFSSLHATGRLGSERFTLVGGHEFGDALRSRKEALEREVNDALARLAK